MIADIEESDVSDINVEGILFRFDSYQDPAIVSRLSSMQRSALRAYIEFVQAREAGLADKECATILRFLDEADRQV